MNYAAVNPDRKEVRLLKSVSTRGGGLGEMFVCSYLFPCVHDSVINLAYVLNREGKTNALLVLKEAAAV